MTESSTTVGMADLWIDGRLWHVLHEVVADDLFLSDINSKFADRIATLEAKVLTYDRNRLEAFSGDVLASIRDDCLSILAYRKGMAA